MIFKKISSFFLSSYFLCLSLALGLINVAHAENTVIAARVWPAQDYTRITLESTKPFSYKIQVIQNPDRVVLDIENIELNQIVKSLTDKILASDPYIKQIRVAKFQQNVVRVVADLKSVAKPSVFTIVPSGAYKHRLVLDIYPLNDPLMAMVTERESNRVATSEKPTQFEPIEEPSLEPLSQSSEVPSMPSNSSVVAPTSSQANKPLENKSSETKPVIANKPALVTTPQVSIESSSEKKAEANSNLKNEERQITIAIDAGHGGEDSGARGATGSLEKNITLIIAKKLKEKIDAEPNMRGVLTRDSDFFIPLHDRVIKARNLQADLFVSIHADAFTNPAARGSSVFALSEKGATSASARYLAKKENESDLIGGVNLNIKDPVLAKTLLDLSQTATINDSLKLGKAVLTQIADINKLHTNHVEQAAFAVLKSPDIPSILVETAFISNPEEERKLNDEVYQEKLVTSILTGIKQYFSTKPALAKTKVAQE